MEPVVILRAVGPHAVHPLEIVSPPPTPLDVLLVEEQAGHVTQKIGEGLHGNAPEERELTADKGVEHTHKVPHAHYVLRLTLRGESVGEGDLRTPCTTRTQS